MRSMAYDHKAVGDRIRKRRTELSMTQEELAEKISRAPKYCADIERGYCGMSIETLLQFCQALNLSPTTLLLGDAVMPADGADIVAALHACLMECTEEQQRNLLETARLFTQRK